MITDRGKGKRNVTHRSQDLYAKSDKRYSRSQWYGIVTAVCAELRKLAANMISVYIPRFGQLEYICGESIVRQRTNLKGETYIVDHRHYNFEDGTRRNGFYIYCKLINKPNTKHYCKFVPTKNLTRDIKNTVYDCNYKLNG